MRTRTGAVAAAIVATFVIPACATQATGGPELQRKPSVHQSVTTFDERGDLIEVKRAAQRQSLGLHEDRTASSRVSSFDDRADVYRAKREQQRELAARAPASS